MAKKARTTLLTDFAASVIDYLAESPANAEKVANHFWARTPEVRIRFKDKDIYVNQYVKGVIRLRILETQGLVRQDRKLRIWHPTEFGIYHLFDYLAEKTSRDIWQLKRQQQKRHTQATTSRL
jgi:hypothetical protein